MIVAAGRRNVWNGLPSVLGDRGVARIRVALRVDRAQRVDLRHALHRRVVLEMRRDHAHVAERRAHDRLERDARHAGNAGVGRIGQQVAIDLLHRQPREDHVAEAPAAAVASAGWSTATPGNRPCSPAAAPRAAANWSSPALPAELGIGEVVGDLLQAEHVEVGEALRLGDDARRDRPCRRRRGTTARST